MVLNPSFYEKKEIPKKDICLYINSPDRLRYIRYCSQAQMRCFRGLRGMVADMGAFLLSAGTKGKRYALKNSRIMIHQVLGGAQGQASDILIDAATDATG